MVVCVADVTCSLYINNRNIAEDFLCYSICRMEINMDNRYNEYDVIDGTEASEKAEASSNDRYAYNAYSSEDNQYKWQPEEDNNKKNKKVKQKTSHKKIIAACIAVCMVFTLINTGAMYYMFGTYLPEKYMAKSSVKISKTLDGTTTNTSAATTTSSGEYTVKEIADLVLPSVVSITSTSYITQGSNPFSHGYTYQVTGAGSGIIIGQNDKELLMVTNDHVVEDTTELTVEFADGEKYEAYVKGTKSKCDIAIVAVSLEKLKTETLSRIKIATLGDSDTLSVGDGVVAIGNALGYGQSVTDGIVSALNREVSTDSYTMNMIQTNAAINGGNSGGALINMKGEVIGINAAKTSTTTSSGSSSAIVEGMGYAIPISDVMDVINEIVSSETKVPVSEEEKGYIGVSVMDITTADAQMYNIEAGVKVVKVYENSGAAEAGLYAGDIISAVNGVDISTNSEMAKELQYYKAGDTVKLTIMANMGKGIYEEKEIEVVLKKYDDIYSE